MPKLRAPRLICFDPAAEMKRLSSVDLAYSPSRGGPALLASIVAESAIPARRPLSRPPYAADCLLAASLSTERQHHAAEPSVGRIGVEAGMPDLGHRNWIGLHG